MPDSLMVIRQKLAALMDVDIDVINAETNIFDDLGADSLDAVELVMALEDEFSLTIEADDVETISTVGDAAALVDRLLAG
jgi:acyl carrier protein